MARRRPSTEAPTSTTESTPAVAVEENTSTPDTNEENTVSVTDEVTNEQPEVEVAEAPAEENGNTEQPAAEAKQDKEKEAPKEVDLTDLKAALDTAVEQRDESTGDLPVAALEPVLVAYRALEGVKGKNKGKAEVKDRVRGAVDEMNITLAKAYMQISDALDSQGASKGGSEPKPPADPTLAYLQRAATIGTAYSLVRSNVPEGVNMEGLDDKVEAAIQEALGGAQSYLEWVQSDDENKGDEPEASVVVKAAVKLLAGKAVKVPGVKSGGGTSPAYSGERRDVARHILEAFAGVEVGSFLTIAEIRNKKSSEYGDDAPSAGAISARLFPKGEGKTQTVSEALESGQKDGRNGATKVGEIEL